MQTFFRLLGQKPTFLQCRHLQGSSSVFQGCFFFSINDLVDGCTNSALISLLPYSFLLPSTQLSDFLAYGLHSFLFSPFPSCYRIQFQLGSYETCNVIYWLLMQVLRLKRLRREPILKGLICYVEMFKHRPWSDLWFRKIIRVVTWGMNQGFRVKGDKTIRWHISIYQDP